jgi:hypothetical protein
MYLHIFEMLFDYFISWLYMCVLKLTLGNIIFLQIFLRFLFFSVKHPDGLLLRSDECSSDGWMVNWHVRTRRILLRADMVVTVRTSKFRIQTGTLEVKNRFSFSFASHSPLIFILSILFSGAFVQISRAFSWVLNPIWKKLLTFNLNHVCVFVCKQIS